MISNVPVSESTAVLGILLGGEVGVDNRHRIKIRLCGVSAFRERGWGEHEGGWVIDTEDLRETGSERGEGIADGLALEKIVGRGTLVGGLGVEKEGGREGGERKKEIGRQI